MDAFSWLTTPSKLRSFALKRAYETSTWVYACIQRIASAAASVPPIFRPGESSYVKIFKTPAFPSIPTWARLIENTFILLESRGGAFWWIRDNKLTLVPIDAAMPAIDADGQLLGWILFKPGTYTPEQALTLKEILPFIYFNPSNPLHGFSPLLPARLALEQLFNMQAWNAEFFEKGMKSPLAIVFKNRLTPQQEEQIRKRLEKFYAGLKGGQSALVLDSEANVVPLSKGEKEIDFVEGLQLTREEICAAFGVPPALVGIFRYANYANTKEQQRIFWRQTMIPKLRFVEEMINAYFDFVGVDEEFQFDLSKVEALKEDALDVAKAAEIYLSLGFSREEVAQILNVPTLAPPKTEVNKQETSDSNIDFKTKDISDEQFIKELWKAVSFMEAEWDKFYRRLLRASVDEILLQAKRRGEVDKSLYISNSNIFRGEAEQVALRHFLLSYVSAIEELERGKIKGLSILNKQLVVEELLAGFDEIERQYAYDVAKEYAYRVTQTTDRIREQIFEITVANLNKPGTTVDSVRREVLQILEERYLGRSLTVARTQTGVALNNARFAAWIKRGVTHHKWITARDSLVRPSHALVSNQIRQLGEPFSNGLLYPHDPTAPAKEVINCRCTTVPVVQKDGLRITGFKRTTSQLAIFEEKVEQEADGIFKALASGKLLQDFNVPRISGYVNENNIADGAQKALANALSSGEMAVIASALSKREGKVAIIEASSALQHLYNIGPLELRVSEKALLSDFIVSMTHESIRPEYVILARNVALGKLLVIPDKNLIALPVTDEHLQTLLDMLKLNKALIDSERFEARLKNRVQTVPKHVARSARKILLSESLAMLNMLARGFGYLIEANNKLVADFAEHVLRERKKQKSESFLYGKFPRPDAVDKLGSYTSVTATAFESVALLPLSTDLFFANVVLPDVYENSLVYSAANYLSKGGLLDFAVKLVWEGF